jgi:hypothetical protein
MSKIKEPDMASVQGQSGKKKELMVSKQSLLHGLGAESSWPIILALQEAEN